MIDRLALFIVRWRYGLVAVVLAMTVTASIGVGRLGFRNDYRMFFSEGNPQMAALDRLQSLYPKNDNVLFVLAPDDGEVFTPQMLASVEWLTDQAWQLPFSSRVDSVTNFQHSYADGDNVVVEGLARKAAGMTPQQVARVRRVAMTDPLLVNRLVPKDGRVTGVNVTIQMPGLDPAGEAPRVAQAARAFAEQLKAQHEGLSVYLTGSVMMDNAFAEATQHDMSTLIPAMLVVVIVAMGLLLRSVGGTIVAVGVMVLAIVPALGLAGWLGIKLSPTSVAAPTIIMTLAVSYSVHILVGFVHAARGGQLDRQQAAVQTLRTNLGPVFLAALTTTIGFVCMNTSDAPPFRDLGNITAFGAVFAFLLSITLLPGALATLPLGLAGKAEHTAGFGMSRLGDWVICHRRTLLCVSGAVAVGLTLMTTRNELNDEFVKYFAPTVDFRRDTDFTTDHLTGIYYVDYSIESGQANGIGDPAFLATVDRFADWCRSQPEVIHVYTVTDIFKRLNQNMHGDDPSYDKLPATKDLTAQYMLLYELSLPYGLDLTDRVSMDRSATRVTVTLKNLSSHQVLAFERRVDAWRRQHTDEAVTVTGSSPTILFAHIGQRNIVSMLSGTTAALVLISLVLMFALRSVKIGLISLIPNLIPAGMAFGLWGLAVGRVGLAVSVVAAMTLGIVVDDTVHFLSKYLYARRQQCMNPHDAVRYAFQTVGAAMWVTSLVLAAGFGVLALSSFEINAGMGLLTAMVIILALVADLLLLPPLVMAIDRRKKDRAPVPLMELTVVPPVSVRSVVAEPTAASRTGHS